MLLKEDTYLIFHIDVRTRYQESEKEIIGIIIILEDGLSKEQILGITGSENC